MTVLNGGRTYQAINPHMGCDKISQNRSKSRLDIVRLLSAKVAAELADANFLQFYQKPEEEAPDAALLSPDATSSSHRMNLRQIWLS
jgi:hypothetical protein